MRATIEYVKNGFLKFNCLYFAGELPLPPITLGNSKSMLGAFVSPRRYPASAPRGVGECYIRISARMDMPEKDVEETIIHEMIHYYIWYKRLADTGPHGSVFRSIMQRINAAGGYNIGVRHRVSEEVLMTAQKCRNNYICVTRWKDIKLGITVCASTRVFEIYRTFNNHPDLIEMKWYWSAAPWFSRFPIARSPKVWNLKEEDYLANFRTATPCICDGKRFRPMNKDEKKEHGYS